MLVTIDASPVDRSLKDANARSSSTYFLLTLMRAFPARLTRALSDQTASQPAAAKWWVLSARGCDADVASWKDDIPTFEADQTAGGIQSADTAHPIQDCARC